MNDLERYFNQNEAGLITKWAHYFEIYDRHLSRYRGTDVNVLEIGVFHGGSLQMWKNYFGQKATIYGLDINPDSVRVEEDQIHIRIGDQADKVFLTSLAADLPQIDVLIDDGGHTMRQQGNTFDVLFPLLAPDGVYVCEDMHSSYWREFGGGYLRKVSFVERSKRLIDSLNAWHSRSRRLDVSSFTESVHGMHFYDSVLVIEKRPMERPSKVSSGIERVEQYRTTADRVSGWLPDSLQPRLRYLRRLARKLYL